MAVRPPLASSSISQLMELAENPRLYGVISTRVTSSGALGDGFSFCLIIFLSSQKSLSY